VRAGPVILAAALAGLALLGGCAGPALERFEFARVCMGVRATIVLYAPDNARAQAAAADAFAEIARLDAMMSDYRPASELSLLGGPRPARDREVSAELAHVLAESVRLAHATGGAFDPTVGPLAALWREALRLGRLPDADALAKARAATGYGLVHVLGRRVTLAAPGMRLDLGGIAKGYAAEHAARRLRALGLPRCLVSLAGDVYAGQPPPGASAWRVEVRPEEGGEAIGTLAIRDAAVSTSGDSAQFVEIDGVRYSHIIDPRTGLGVTRRRAVTVIARRGAAADALATALCVMEPGAAGRLAHEMGVGVIVAEAADVRVHDPAGLVRWAVQPGPAARGEARGYAEPKGATP
jgi:FAD:protein FMN transferase